VDRILEKKKGIQKKHLPYITGGVILLAVLAWMIFGDHRSKFNANKEKLTIQSVVQGEFNDYIRINGQVQPINTIQLSAIEGGMVAEKVAEEGSMVRRGEVIVCLTNSMLNLNILDSEAQLAEKQNFLRNTQVTVEIGQSVGSGARIGQISVLSDYKIEAMIDEHYIDRVRNGLSATFERQDKTFRLTVRKIYPEVRDKLFKTDFVLEGERPDNIRTGQTYYINLQLGQPAEALLIPRGSFYQNTGGQWIFVVSSDGKKALRRPIRIGRQNPLVYMRIPKAERKQRVDTALRRMSIGHRAQHFPNQLSGGQQQRVAIARAVVANPKLILADEPTGNLDSKNGLEVMTLLSELNREGATIVMVTHSQHAAAFAHKIINLFDGKIVAEVQSKM
jgi:ABC-type dipeptide/oligopeptide/nickel transport system ATPase component